MTALAHRTSRMIAVVAVVVACQGIGLSSTPCDELARWARAYEGAAPTLADMARLDRPRRIAVFNTITPERRADLWRVHLTQAAARPELSDAQRAVIADAVLLTTSALYRGDLGARAAFGRVWSRADRLFLTAEQRAIWFDLGMTTAAPRGAAAADDGDCSCNLSHQWPECFGECEPAFCNHGIGCGPGGFHMCNGRCRAQ